MFLNKCRVDSIPCDVPPAVDDGKMANVVARHHRESLAKMHVAGSNDGRRGHHVADWGLIQVASFGHHTLQEIASGDRCPSPIGSPPPRLRRHRSQLIVSTACRTVDSVPIVMKPESERS